MSQAAGAPPGDALPRAREPDAAPTDEGPPFLGSWSVLYALILVELAGIILLCYWITLRNA